MKCWKPEVTVFIAAYNEADCIERKLRNTLDLSYPEGKLHIVVVTDGSTDGTDRKARAFKDVRVFHQDTRQGKLAAVNRVMPFVLTPITVFTDANTLLNNEALDMLVCAFHDPFVGAVAGEKRIAKMTGGGPAEAGEGLYWRYESALKKFDSRLVSVVGAAGELFAIRTHLYENLPSDTIIEDFVLTLGIAAKGYRVVYEPRAYATELASASVKEEMKRKVRIAAGGFQAMVRKKELLDLRRYGLLSYTYISHRVLRWAVIPFLLPLMFASNAYLSASVGGIYELLFAGQSAFYLLGLLGWVLEKAGMKVGPLMVPLYFMMMNGAVYVGLARYLRGSQSAVWERAERASMAMKGAVS